MKPGAPNHIFCSAVQLVPYFKAREREVQIDSVEPNDEQDFS